MEEKNKIIKKSESTAAISTPIENLIHIIRGQQVMLGSDLAKLYGVETKRLKEQVKRNINRFPPDFLFELTKEEFQSLRSQFATSNQEIGRGGRRYLPYVFTESEVAKKLRQRILDIVIGTINSRDGGGTKYINWRDRDYLPIAIKSENY